MGNGFILALVVFMCTLVLTIGAMAQLSDLKPDINWTPSYHFKFSDGSGVLNFNSNSTTLVTYYSMDIRTMLTVDYCTKKGCHVCRSVTKDIIAPVRKDGIDAGATLYKKGETYCNIETAKVIQFGAQSTVIHFQSDTSNVFLEDGEVSDFFDGNGERGDYSILSLDDDNSVDFEFLTKLNISSPDVIPSGKVIDNAIMSYYWYGSNLDTGEYIVWDTIHVYNNFTVHGGDWDEGPSSSWTQATGSSINFDDLPTNGYFNPVAMDRFNMSDANDSGYTDFNFSITEAVSFDYNAGNDNTTIWQRVDDAASNMGYDYIGFRSKEYGAPNEAHLFITYSEGGADETPPSPTWDSNMAANLSYTDNESYVFYMINSTENIGGCLLDCNATNYTMTVSGDDCYLNRTGLTNQSTYACFGYVNDTAGNLNVTSSLWYTINLTSLPACENNLMNTTKVYDNTSCLPGDAALNWSNWTQWDYNDCGDFSNISWSEYYANISCDYCSPSWYEINDSWSHEGNTTAIQINGSCNSSGFLDFQTWNWTEWNWTTGWFNDSNSCGEGGAPSNNSYYDNTSWGNYSFNVNCTYTPPSTVWTPGASFFMFKVMEWIGDRVKAIMIFIDSLSVQKDVEIGGCLKYNCSQPSGCVTLGECST